MLLSFPKELFINRWLLTSIEASSDQLMSQEILLHYFDKIDAVEIEKTYKRFKDEALEEYYKSSSLGQSQGLDVIIEDGCVDIPKVSAFKTPARIKTVKDELYLKSMREMKIRVGEYIQSRVSNPSENIFKPLLYVQMISFLFMVGILPQAILINTSAAYVGMLNYIGLGVFMSTLTLNVAVMSYLYNIYRTQGIDFRKRLVKTIHDFYKCGYVFDCYHVDEGVQRRSKGTFFPQLTKLIQGQWWVCPGLSLVYLALLAQFSSTMLSCVPIMLSSVLVTLARLLYLSRCGDWHIFSLPYPIIHTQTSPTSQSRSPVFISGDKNKSALNVSSRKSLPFNNREESSSSATFGGMSSSFAHLHPNSSFTKSQADVDKVHRPLGKMSPRAGKGPSLSKD